ncbi:MAG: hypothetical protein V1752_04720 [Candidatus Firestonebacteria bacterium]
MKKIILVLFIAMIGTVNAGSIYFDAEVKYTNVFNRYIRIATDVAPDIKARLTYNTLNGYLALTGDMNNFSLGGQTVTSIKLMDELTADPFAGIGFASSDAGTAVYGNLGVDLKYKTLVWLIAGADIQIYSDSYMMDYRGGINVPILDFLSLDLLYTSTLTNDKHKIGFGGRINLVF